MTFVRLQEVVQNLSGKSVLRLILAGVVVVVTNTVSGTQSENDVLDDRERVAAVVRHATDFSKPESYERRSGGAATVFTSANADAFSDPSGNMSFKRQLDFAVGNGIFRKIWVSSPSSTQSSDGLGPLFNSRSCQSCHVKDGRGHPPVAGERAESLLIRLSIPPRNKEDREAIETRIKSSVPDPVYGGQLQNFSV